MRTIRKKISKVLSLSLAVAMALGLASVQDIEAHAAWVTKNGSIVDEIEPAELKTGRETLSIYMDYVIRSMEDDFGEEDVIAVTCAPITFESAGTLYIEPLDYHVATSMEFSLYKDAECTEKVDESAYWELVDEEGEFSEIKMFNVAEPGTYYLGTISDRYFGKGEKSAHYDNVVKFKPYFVSNEDKNMRSGSWTVIDRKGEADQYLAFDMKEDGYATFKAGVDMSFEICDSEKIMIEEKELALNEEYTVQLNKGTYYIKTSGIEDTYSSLKFTFTTKIEVEEERDIVEVNPAVDEYVQYVATDTGYLTVTNVSPIEDGKVSLALCDSNKKVISLITNTSTSSGTDGATYGVIKDGVYYIQAQSELVNVLLDQKLTAVSENSGLEKSDAVEIPKNTLVEGTITIGSGEDDWYKFKISERQEASIYIDSIINGIMQAELYNSSGKKLATVTLDKNNDRTQLRSTGTMKPDTYYLKLSPVSEVTTGYYNIEWK